jgi:hypothetical protein
LPAFCEVADDSKCGTLATTASALAAAATSALFFVTRMDTDKDLKGTLHQCCIGSGQEGCSICEGEEPRRGRSITASDAREEIGLEEGEMDAGRSCVGAKGERVRWAPPVSAVFRRCQLTKLGSYIWIQP